MNNIIAYDYAWKYLLIIAEIFHINFVTLGKFKIGVSYQPSFFTVLLASDVCVSGNGTT